MSELLLETKRISIDTSFKRVHKWQKFEIEAWFSQYNRSVVVARAFINSQSSEAHLVLFQQIFGIAEADTGKQVQIRHIHGEGIDTITADGHRGQAIDWFRAKEAADSWALAAIYRPKSKIPVHIWEAAPSTSNGDEQAHRNINREGTKLAIVAGILFGQGVDFRQLEGIGMLLTHGITHRDQPQTYFRRSGRTIIRSVAVQERKVKENDSTLQKSYTELSKLQDDATKEISTLKRAMEMGTASEPSIKRLRTIEKKYGDGYSTLSTLECRSSGRIQAPELIEPSKLLPSHVFEVSQSQKPVQPHRTSHCTSPLRPPPPQFVGSHQTYSNSSAPCQFLNSHEPPPFQWISNGCYTQLNKPFAITDSLPQFTSVIAATTATTTSSWIQSFLPILLS
ncbi:hypothetical protein M422DRAFT_271984 [Sphaerobolus stellatus SS14]|uniref:Uncharacterized protein n=1 Tax=Sphaerobolus stellatus (strain SS14) TaxID=990650 RepID=A0A0C9TCJ7_SPHS4|nr:hypothetical protein M422DRAFT_271984 [Sphaerobolus stellatus SS14]